MTDMYAHVSVRILEKEYQVSCPASERTELLDSAELLNSKMRGNPGQRKSGWPGPHCGDGSVEYGK